ncbi:MAG TPA: serine/threonine-protein kinase [Gemmatales bacterium]|nr:serine/threonine-protein kinase [Gemmatales bacterium]HMP58044.1 serine/threonine-protein kinase [Gemmatales bacterium]
MPGPSPDFRSPSGRKSAGDRKESKPSARGSDPGGASPDDLAGSAQLSFDPNHPLLQRDGLEIPGFELLGEIGRGNMGVIYKARQTKLNRVVALKMILSGKHADSTQLKRFQTEAESVGRLHHPNIVQIYNVGEYEDQPYLVMEYIDGGSLDRKLRGRTLPAKQAAQLVQTLARAIQAAHEQGIIHRDLKPGNILLTARGVPKITDFGLAKKLDEDMRATATGTILGTPSYMAPEQARANKLPVSPATDVYGLGAILYELLTGRPPFKEETFLDTMLQVVSSPPVSPSEINPRVPIALEEICLRCLSKDPTERYLTAAGLAEALSHFLSRQSTPHPARGDVLPVLTPIGEARDENESVVDLASASASVVVPPADGPGLGQLMTDYPIASLLTLATGMVYMTLASWLAWATPTGAGVPIAVLPLVIGLIFLNLSRWVTITGGLAVAGIMAAAIAQGNHALLVAPSLLGIALGVASRGFAWALDKQAVPALLGGALALVASLIGMFIADKPVHEPHIWKSANATLVLAVIASVAAIIVGSFTGALLASPVRRR